MEVTQWPPWVALLKLRMSLMDKTKSYRLGPDIDIASLRTRISISAIDAQARLQKLRRDPRTTLQELAATVMKLAQIAYSDLPQVNRERYTFYAFVQFVNNLGLHHKLLARGATTIEGTLAEGEAYLANKMHKNCGVSRQLEVEPVVTRDDTEAGPPHNCCRRTANGHIEGLTTD